MDNEFKWIVMLVMGFVVMAGLVDIFAPRSNTFETEQKLEGRDIHHIKIEDGDTTFIYKPKK